MKVVKNQEKSKSRNVEDAEAEIVEEVKKVEELKEVKTKPEKARVIPLQQEQQATLLPLKIQWAPKTNITTYELAQCLPVMIAGSLRAIMPYELDNTAPFMRHFVVEDPNIKK